MVALKYKLDKFEGPLDLLLQLIESADLDITEVSIAQVADQFMEYLEQVEEPARNATHSVAGGEKSEELADFLVVASRLLLIKSKVLLPNLDLGNEESGEDLEKQLKIYKEFHEASKNIEKILLEKKILFAREKIPMDVDVIFNPPKKINSQNLKQIFKEILKDIEPIIKIPEKAMERVVSIKEKIKSITNKIQNGLTNFDELIKDAKNRTEVVITFLGILELVKQRVAKVKQDDKFGEISISRVHTSEDASSRDKNKVYAE